MMSHVKFRVKLPVKLPTKLPLLCSVLLLGSLGLSGCSKSQDDEAAAPSALTVKMVMPQSVTWPQQISANGALLPWQEAVISAETGPFRIAAIHVDVGSHVRKGQLLASLSQDSIRANQAQLQAQVAQAEANLAKAKSDMARVALVGDSGGLSAQQIESYRVSERSAKASLDAARAMLQNGQIQLGQSAIRAVDDGVVSSRTALLGKVVNAGEELFRLVRQGRIEWQAELDANQLSGVKTGSAAQVTLPDGTVVDGTVRMLAPTLNGNSSRAIAYIQLPTHSSARAGMYGSGTIDIGTAEVLTVPDTAVILRDGKSYVYLVQKDNIVRMHQVTAGLRRDNRVAIQGVSASAHIVESGGAFLSDGASVRVERSAAK